MCIRLDVNHSCVRESVCDCVYALFFMLYSFG